MSSRMLMIALRLLVFIAFESLNADAFVSELRLSGTANMAPITVPRRNVRRHASEKEEWGRRCFLVATTAACLTVPLEYSWASDLRDRVTGYTLQKSDGEWKQSLTSKQYFVLREGGTEKPYSSPLEKEKRAGTFACAGCGVPLFSSEAKFNSGTGWPSFATALAAVEEEKVGTLRRGLAGAELRCGRCGGHLGDVFGDGWAFPETAAFTSGQRHCIDGAALVFLPKDGGGSLSGDGAA
mmetsp:Transcript_15382/g.31619  ORF Transcript_15382/g.31619 Transcript_15382/m.31619 type:complete len:239 (-) Transcript_15382:289-1005(-)